MPKFLPEMLERMAIRLFVSAGVPDEEAQIVAAHLVAANLAGHDSHGVLRLPQYLKAIKTGQVRLGVKPVVLVENGATAALDGQGGFGQVAARHAMTLAMAKARQFGVSAVTMRNSYHTGRIASYTSLAAAVGLAAVVMGNAGGSGQSVAPFGGLCRRLATNPLSIAVPGPDVNPIVLDIATSVAPEGKVRDFWLKGKSVPPGWIIDAKGQPTTNPADFYTPPGGALLPLGGPAGYKGFGLALMIDILVGALSGAGCCRPDVLAAKDGLLMIVLEVERFVRCDLFQQQVEALVAYVKSCSPAPGFTQVQVPGEVEWLEERRRRQEGIDLDEGTWREICDSAAELGVHLSGFNLFSIGDSWPRRPRDSD
jgi:uncharacterized oxidoreductase